MELTVAQKLEALLKLQSIDSKLNEIRKVRGDLPEEVRDLEDEIAGYDARIARFKEEIKGTDTEIDGFKIRIKDSEKLIAKYKEQQMNVRNNREFDAVSKEIELQELEMQIAEKKIKESKVKIERKKEEIQETSATKEERLKDLQNKKSELDGIIAEGQEEENKLLKEREKAAKNVDDRLFYSYERIRKNAVNGLAVVTVKRDACGGCFNTVPPQRQADIREKKKIIVCEHCGRVLADVEEKEVEVKMR
jgi:predicted  nucleic acid-binding Zn-ribbon protein